MAQARRNRWLFVAITAICVGVAVTYTLYSARTARTPRSSVSQIASVAYPHRRRRCRRLPQPITRPCRLMPRTRIRASRGHIWLPSTCATRPISATSNSRRLIRSMIERRRACVVSA